MIIKLNDKLTKETNIGNKALSLVQMKTGGFNVPDGFVFDSGAFDLTIRENGMEGSLGDILKNLKKSNLQEMSANISAMFSETISSPLTLPPWKSMPS